MPSNTPEYQKQYRLNHKEQVKASAKKWRKKHVTELNATSTEWRRENKAQWAKIIKASRAKHKDDYNIYEKDYRRKRYNSDQVFREKCLEAGRKSYAKKLLALQQGVISFAP